MDDRFSSLYNLIYLTDYCVSCLYSGSVHAGGERGGARRRGGHLLRRRRAADLLKPKRPMVNIHDLKNKILCGTAKKYQLHTGCCSPWLMAGWSTCSPLLDRLSGPHATVTQQPVGRTEHQEGTQRHPALRRRADRAGGRTRCCSTT